MFQVALGDSDQVGNQVIAPLQLHIDLGKRIAVAVAQLHQLVVQNRRQTRRW